MGVNRYRTLSIVSLVLTIVFAFVGLIGFANSNTTLGAIFAILFVIFFIAYGSLKTASRKICNSCGSSMFGCAYKYDTINIKGRFLSGGFKYKIHFNATCPTCGKPKSFKHTFRGRTGDNMAYFIDKYADKLYGDRD